MHTPPARCAKPGKSVDVVVCGHAAAVRESNRPSHSPAKWKASFFSQRNQIRKQPIRPRHAGGQVRGTKPDSCRRNSRGRCLATRMPPFKRRFARIVAGHHRREVFVPLIGEINAALLHPALEIGRRDFVRRVECRMIGGQNRDRRLFVGYAIVRKFANRTGPVDSPSPRRADCIARSDCRRLRRNANSAGRCDGKSFRTLNARMPITTASNPRRPLFR